PAGNAGTASTTRTFTVGAPTPSAGGPYTISEGDSLTLAATVPGTPSFTRDFDLDRNGTFERTAVATGATPTLTVAQRLAAGTADDGVYNVRVRTTYGAIAGATSPTATFTILDAGPTATFDN